MNYENFWSKVTRGEPDACWHWTAATRSGYGVLGGPGGEVLYAHRVSWSIANGREVPMGLFVCHRCDVRTCVNPAHLFVGTPRDNIADMHAKGRARKAIGFANAKTKLSEDNVRGIRGLLCDGLTPAEIARRFEISRTTVVQIREGRTFRWLP